MSWMSFVPFYQTTAHNMQVAFATVAAGAAALLTLPALGSRLAPSVPTQLEATTPYGGADSSLLQFPGDWSRKTPPIPVHAHNAYLQPAFVYTALSYGVRSIEVDVWLYKDELYVGHDPFQLTKERTFTTFAVDAVLKAIEQANSGNHNKSSSESALFFKDLQIQEAPTDWWGYYGDISTPVQLLIDLKTDGEKTWPKVIEQLQPLRERGYLTRYENGKIIPGAVLVIGTGNTPADQLVNEHQRDVFIDGPLGNFSKPIKGGGEWNNTLSPLASVDFATITSWKGLDEPSDEVKRNITAVLDESHGKNIEARFWNTPQWPLFARDRVNKVLLQLGADWINADDLEAIARKF